MSLAGHETTEMLPVQALFSYDVLDAETREWAKQEGIAIRQLYQNAAQQVITIGKKLINVRERVPKGFWLIWIRDEFPWGQATATNLIQIAEAFGDLDLSAVHLSAHTLKLLSRPSLPPSIRQEARNIIASEGSLSRQEALELVERADPHLTAVHNTWDRRRARDDKTSIRIAHELLTATRHLQVSLADAYGVPLRGSVARALQRLYDLVTAIEDEDERKQFIPDPQRFPTRRTQKAASRFWGVSKETGSAKWRGRVQSPEEAGKRILVGYFDTEEAAAHAVDAKARELYGDQARLNFPDEHP